MKTPTIIAIVIVTITCITGITIVMSAFGWYDSAVSMETSVKAQYHDNQNRYDSFWKSVQEVAQVQDKYKEDFKEVFDEVNGYMETHNQSNTDADELSAAYSDFAAAFAEMKEVYETAEPAEEDEAEYDKMFALMEKAETSMSKYSDGIAKGVPEGIQLSLEGATLWDEVRNEFGGAV